MLYCFADHVPKDQILILAGCDGHSRPASGNRSFDRPSQNGGGGHRFHRCLFDLWIIFQKGMAKLGIILTVAGVIGCGWLVGQLNEREYTGDESVSYDVYVGRAKTVFEDIPARVVELGIAPVKWAYDSFGFFGAGLGVGTQGTQYFGGGGQGAAEGGLGKVTLELGIPGLFAITWLAISILRHLWQIMRAASKFHRGLPTFLRPFWIFGGQRGGVLCCHASLWRFVYLAYLGLDCWLPAGNSGALRTRGACAAARRF